MLATGVLTEGNILRRKCKLISVGSRACNQILQVNRTVAFLILHSIHLLAKLYLDKAHRVGHEGTISLPHRSRNKVWVIRGRQLADLVHQQCIECMLKEKKCLEQRMGPLSDHPVGPRPMSQAVAAELLRPRGFRGTTNKSQTFVCPATSAIHVEFIELYFTDSFLMALGRFMCVRGTPLLDPVRPGRPAGGCFQADRELGL
jgi:hypothetical protein